MLYGGDIDFQARATDNLTISASANVLRAKFGAFPGAAFNTQLPDGRPDLGRTGNAKGNDVPYSPKFTSTIGATYTIPAAVGTFAINLNDNYNSGFYSEADNFLRQKSYHFLNAPVAWTSADEKLTARLFVNNILDEAVASQLPTISGFSYIADYTNPPRIFGGSVEMKF